MSTAYDPTPRLRWLERTVEVLPPGGIPEGEHRIVGQRTEIVLQYGLRPLNSNRWDWFDVPAVKEEPKP